MLSLLPSQTHWSRAGYLGLSSNLKLRWCAWSWSSTRLWWEISKEHVPPVCCHAKLQRTPPHQGSGLPHRSSVCSGKSLLSAQPAIRGKGTAYLGIQHRDVNSCFLLRYFSFQNTYFTTIGFTAYPAQDRMGGYCSCYSKTEGFTTLWYLHLFHRYSPDPNRMAALCHF